MTNIVVIVVRDEEFYIDMCLESILPYIDKVYILDTGSADSTVEIIKSYSYKYHNIVLEEKYFGGKYSFDSGYKELEARNYALSKAKELFSPDWIICMDADEVYNDKFWDYFNLAIKENKFSICHGTELLSSSTTLYKSKDSVSIVQGHEMFDTHSRVWNNKIRDVKWHEPVGAHVTLGLSGEFAIQEPVHFHLHRTFGPKSIYTWLFWRGDPPINPGCYQKIDYNIFNIGFYKKNYPELFTEGGKFTPPKEVLQRNLEVSITVNSTIIPQFVLEKWKLWGIW